MNKLSVYTHGARYFKWSLILSVDVVKAMERCWKGQLSMLGCDPGSVSCSSPLSPELRAPREMYLYFTLIRLSWVSVFISLKHFTLQRHLKPHWIFGEGPSLKAWLITRTGSPQHQACHFKEHLLHDLVLGDPVRSRELDLRILMGPFQLKIFYDSIRALLSSHQIADCCFMEDFWMHPGSCMLTVSKCAWVLVFQWESKGYLEVSKLK